MLCGGIAAASVPLHVFRISFDTKSPQRHGWYVVVFVVVVLVVGGWLRLYVNVLSNAGGFAQHEDAQNDDHVHTVASFAVEQVRGCG